MNLKKRQQFLQPGAPWIDLLNAMQKEWREGQIHQGRNPDPEIERLLCEACKWGPDASMLGMLEHSISRAVSLCTRPAPKMQQMPLPQLKF